MTNKNTIDCIAEILRSSDLSWLLPNLRQDFTLWTSLNDPAFIEKFIQAKAGEKRCLAADFSPSKLALLALDQINSLTSEPKELLDSIDPQMLLTAVSSYPELISARVHRNDLANAGLIALGLADKHRATNSWKELIDTLLEGDSQTWLTAVSCLYGITDEPQELLKALVQPGGSGLRYKLAIHAVLSNPMTIKEQLSILCDLFYGPYGDLLPSADRSKFLDVLYSQNSQVAVEFCTLWMNMQPVDISLLEYNDPLLPQRLEQLAEVNFQIQLRELSGSLADLPALRTSQEAMSHDLYARLLDQILLRRINTSKDKVIIDPPGETSDTLFQLVDQVLPFISSPGTQADLALTFNAYGLREAGQKLDLSNDSLPDNPAILYSIALIALQAGEREQSFKAASRLVEILTHEHSVFSVPVWGEHFSLINLGRLLVDLGKPVDAASVLEAALQSCPNELAILKLLAESYSSAHQDSAAANTYCALVSLCPGNLDDRRAYADSLARLDQWEDCLRERSAILDPRNGFDKLIRTEDLYRYSHAALKANRPELTVKTCEDILANNPEDCQAIVYLAKAYIALDDAEKGMDYLLQATQASPGCAEAWLVLADAQRKFRPARTAVETLVNASLALTECAQIQYMLGELYLQDNSPTLALPVFQRAVELSPDNPEILVGYAQALIIIGRTDEARQVLSQAYQLEPSYPGLALIYAKNLIELHKVEEAIAPLELLMESKSVLEPSFYLDYARCILSANKNGSTAHPPMKALIALNEVIQIAPEIIEARALIAEVLKACGENELAYQAYHDALETELKQDKKWLERLSYGFGCTAIAIGKFDVAIAALQEASLINQENPVIFMALSDAFLMADLLEDAVRTARNVLIIDGDNPDNLSWFASQMTKIIGLHPQVLLSSSGNIFKYVTAEVLTALNKAIQLAPTRVDLIVQLGNFQSLIGDADNAKITLATISTLDFATITDLINAADHLRELDDHYSAITCLEKAAFITTESPDLVTSTLYKNLAQEYLGIHDQASALSTLDKAISLLPEDISIVTMKVNILLEMGQSKEALDCIEGNFQDASRQIANVDLLFLASRITRSMGCLTNSVKYARLAVSSLLLGDKQAHLSKLPIRYRTRIAELYRSLLQPHQAFGILNASVESQPNDFENENEYQEYLCLHTELAFEVGGEVRSGIQSVQVEPADPYFIRLAALKARLMNKNGDANQAYQLFEYVVNKASLQDSNHINTGWETPYHKYLQAISLCEAAMEIGAWEYSFQFIRQILDHTDGELLPYLTAARMIIHKEEFEQQCDAFEVVTHRVKNTPDGTGSYSACIEYLEKVQSLLDIYRQEPIINEIGFTDYEINRWRARANISFITSQDPQAVTSDILTQKMLTDDMPSLIRDYYRQALSDPDSDAMTKIIKIARSYPKEPGIILQAAIALQDNSPESAVRSLQSVLQENPAKMNPIMAFCNILLANLSMDLEDYTSGQNAVEAAIAFWSDEPRWHAIAAQIGIGNNNIRYAVDHLNAATKLAPSVLTYHMQLGMLYLENSNEDRNVLSMALRCFETAISLKNDDVDAYINLATTEYLLNDNDNANENARNALLLAPDRAEIYQLLSVIAIRSNDYQGAYEYANKALLISPKDVQSIVVLAKSLSALGRHHDAIAKLNAAIQESQHPEELYLERVAILYKMAGPRAALNELVSLNNSYPENFEILDELSKVHAEVGEFESAVMVAQQALKTASDKTSTNEQANIHLLLGQVYRKSGHLDLSIDHLSEAIRLAPDRLEPYLELGLARKERREYQQALLIFEQATSIAPEDPRAPYQAGMALKESKDYKSSEIMLRRAVSLAPNDLSIRRQLAAVVALNLVHNPRLGRS